MPNCHGGAEEFTDHKERERAPAQRQTDTMGDGEEEAAELAMSPAAGGGATAGAYMAMAWARLPAAANSTDGGVRQPRSANTGATGDGRARSCSFARFNDTDATRAGDGAKKEKSC